MSNANNTLPAAATFTGTKLNPFVDFTFEQRSWLSSRGFTLNYDLTTGDLTLYTFKTPDGGFFTLYADRNMWCIRDCTRSQKTFVVAKFSLFRDAIKEGLAMKAVETIPAAA